MVAVIGRINEEYRPVQVKLDAKDREILRLLSRNSRMAATQIAKKVRLSRDAVGYRINRLVDKKVILGFFAEIKYRKLGFYTFDLLLQIDERNAEKSNRLMEEIKSHPNVVNVTQYNDKWDMEIVFLARSVLEFDRILSEFQVKYSDMVIERSQLQLIKTYTLSHVPYDTHYTSDFTVPMAAEKEKLDETDVMILKSLSQNCRVPNYEIGQKVGLSPDAVAYRIKNLVKKGIIKVFTVMLNYSLLNYDWYTFAIRLKMIDPANEAKFKAFVNNHPLIRRATKTLGQWDLLLYVVAPSPKEFHGLVKEIKTSFSDIIGSYQTWLANKELFFEPFPAVLQEAGQRSGKTK